MSKWPDEKFKEIFKIEKVEPKVIPQRTVWNKFHDALLTELIKQFKEQSWELIARKMNQSFPGLGFSAKNCSRRWTNCINPEINRSYLNDAEELLLIAYHYSFRNKWGKIVEKLPSRNSRVLSDNFYCLLKKTARRIAQDESLILQMTPLAFIQNLYMIIYIDMLISLPENLQQKNNMVPLYIYHYLKDIGITQKMCIKITEKLLEELANKYPNETTLLKKCSYDKLAKEIFPNLVVAIKANITPVSVITDGKVFSLFTKAFEMTGITIQQPHINLYPPYIFSIHPTQISFLVNPSILFNPISK